MQNRLPSIKSEQTQSEINSISSAGKSIVICPQNCNCAGCADLCDVESRFLNTNFYGSRNFLVGSLGGQSGSILGQNELEKMFPQKKISIRIITWNMAGQESLATSERFPELVGGNDSSSSVEILVLCTQETPHNSRELLIKMQSVLGPHYVLFSHAENGSLDICVFIKRDLIWYTSVSQFSSISTRSAVQTKGAVVVTFILFGTSFAFINSHFKANENNFHQRLQDYERILEEFDLPKPGFSSGYRHKSGNPMDRFDMVFWAGDLNFRLKMTREEVDTMLAKNADPITFLQTDELIEAMESGEVFKGFHEAKINFRPTFKFDLNSDIYDSSDKKRVPSYTDRILFKNRREEELKCLDYDSIKNIRCSDHRPVYALFAVILKPGRDNIALSAGAFHREIYIEGNRRRTLEFDVLKSRKIHGSSTVCSLQ